MTALAPSSILMSAVPFAASPDRPLLAVMTLFLIVTRAAWMSIIPVMFSQLITVPGVVIVMVLDRVAALAPSGRPEDPDGSGPVSPGPGQPQAARFPQSALPPCWQ